MKMDQTDHVAVSVFKSISVAPNSNSSSLVHSFIFWKTFSEFKYKISSTPIQTKNTRRATEIMSKVIIIV